MRGSNQKRIISAKNLTNTLSVKIIMYGTDLVVSLSGFLFWSNPFWTRYLTPKSSNFDRPFINDTR